MLDEEYVEAMEYGMPPAAGFGVSERLFAMLADRAIRETVIFPPMKAEGNQTGKSKETKIAVAIINEGANLEPWQRMNTIAHLTASLGAREGKGLLYQDSISTKDGIDIALNIQHAIMIKSSNSADELRDLLERAKQHRLEVTEFTREMIETTNDKKVIEITASKDYEEVEFLGVLVFGDKSEVEKLTEQFSLVK